MTIARLRAPRVIAAVALAPALAVALLLPTRPAAAQAAAPLTGAWHLAGQLNGHAFTAECQFTPATAGFGGSCIDNKHKKHVLTSGTISGDTVRFSYEASVMMMNFPVNFTGTLKGSAMAGTIAAAGKSGNFTGARG